MKIVFLYTMDDSVGGIEKVNVALAREFMKRGDEVIFVTMRHFNAGKEKWIPVEARHIMINDFAYWGCPRYSTALRQLKSAKFKEAAGTLLKRIKYNRSLRADYIKCKRVLAETDPDIIINSHYELLDCIPENLLCITINHFHNAVDQINAVRSCRNVLMRYKERVGKFVWLTEASCKGAKKLGLSNSAYIYNPVPIECEGLSDNSEKSIVFVGRIAQQKRPKLLLQMFSETTEKYGLHDWKLDIYGVGKFDDECCEILDNNPNISFWGSTDDAKASLMGHSIFMMTSEFEGMPMAVLEANECGIPVITTNFGESVYEIVRDGDTGVIVPLNDTNQYVAKLHELMENEEYRRKLGQNAKAFVKKFKVESIAREWYKLFDEITK